MAPPRNGRKRSRSLKASFEDPYLDAPRVLFIGNGESSHTHAWVDLLATGPFNVRLFALPTGVPPDDWPVRTYVTASTTMPLAPATRARLYAADRVRRYPKKGYARFLLRGASLEERWLAKIVREWRPHVIHTLGLDPASTFYHRVRQAFSLEDIGTWVVQLRGGADLALSRFDPHVAPGLGVVMRDCDQLLDDNEQNLSIARTMGVRAEQLATIGTVPGAGGLDLGLLDGLASSQPSSRRVIVWPKAYESPWSKSLPVIEALSRVWDRLAPCEIHLLAVEPETRMWFNTLPPAIKARCHLAGRVPHREALTLMAGARVMLAPSLVDGVPNTLLEAMATGALPIVSPLETIRPLVHDGENGLYARNLYPDEIARALERAMRDDALVDRAAALNRVAVREIADRSTIMPRVRAWYSDLASAGARRRS
jgi:hypothetical protein